MQRPHLSVNVDVRPELRVRRPPRQLIELLDRPEDEFRAYVRQIEDTKLFHDLVEAGAIRRVRTRGRVPREKYEEYMDAQLMQFLRQYNVTRHDGWERDFLSRDAAERVPEMADKYGAPAEKLRKMIEYYQRVMSEDYVPDTYGGSGGFDDSEPDYVELIPSRADVDMTDNIVLLREFVETYDIGMQDFVRDFLKEPLPLKDLVERYNAPPEDVREIMETLGTVDIAETFMASGAAMAPGARTSNAPREAVEPVARVLLTDGNRSVAIQFSDESVYAERYRTSPDALGTLSQQEVSARAEELLLELQWINQRKTLLCRLVMAVCNYQYRYLLTGDVNQLKPLSQADMARELGEDEATICRLLRDKFVDTPYGPIDLRFLFQKKTDVIRRIVERHPELTDNEIRRILEHDYDTKISRRTVAYHRLKFQRDQEELANANGDAALASERR